MDPYNAAFAEFDEYQKGVLNLLREFAKFYQPQGPAEGHFSANAADLSQKISRFVEMSWAPNFSDLQWPQIQRKHFYKYEANDPQGN